MLTCGGCDARLRLQPSEFLQGDGSKVVGAELEPSSLSFNRSSYYRRPYFYLSGVQDYDNAAYGSRVFTVQCDASSNQRSGVYSRAYVRSTVGVTRNVVAPLFMDVFVRLDTGEWASSVFFGDIFSLPLSRSETVAIVGDFKFRTENGPHLSQGTMVSALA